jgi:hypothetical protein
MKTILDHPMGTIVTAQLNATRVWVDKLISWTTHPPTTLPHFPNPTLFKLLRRFQTTWNTTLFWLSWMKYERQPSTFLKMEDDHNFYKWKTTSIFFQNQRQPKFFDNGKQPWFLKMEDNQQHRQPDQHNNQKYICIIQKKQP